MKRNIVLLLSLLIPLFSSLSFFPVHQVYAGTPTGFTATIHLVQVAVVNVQRGDSDRYRTVTEEFTGSVISSDWPAISGATVKMDEFTNYELVPGAIPGTFDIQGTAHSTMEIIVNPDSKLTIKANGKIKGTIPFGATIEANFNSIGGTGTLADNHAVGKLTAAFSWLTVPPSGVATLTGQYQ